MRRIFTMLSAALLLFACGNNDNTTDTTPADNSQPDQSAPAVIGYQLLKTYPHDSTAYTEGLQYVDGKLLESTGEYGQSDIRFVEINTGKLLQKNKLSNEYFGEGCTLVNGKIYQLTYQEKTCFVYDSATLKKNGEFNYGFGEGWGMTSNGRDLIISNGSSNLYFYDPASFKEIKRLGVTNQYGPVGNINELELIKGFIYANIWQTDNILKIDTASGKVVGVINLGDLRGKLGLPPTVQQEGQPEVLNGIAYDAPNNRIFITGKYWPKLCEVKFDN
jgi:glutamine cyclotransferase